MSVFNQLNADKIPIPKLIYRLGHCWQLAIEEINLINQFSNYRSETQIIKDLKHQPKYLFLNEGFLINPNKLGSVVYVGQVVMQTNNKTNLIDLVKQSLSKITISKKLGIAIVNKQRHHTLNQKEIINLAKEVGFKQINVVFNEPNYGHFKTAKNWLIIDLVDNQNLLVINLLDKFNQDFWAYLDANLPATDIKRGVINLKLARSMLNLVKSHCVYDPFAGQARILVSGLDIKTEFWASDIDPKVIYDIYKNWEFAQKFFQKNNHQLANLNQVFVNPAENIENLKKYNQDLAIVTEGYLGENTGQTLSKETIKRTFINLEKIWNGLLTKAGKHSYQEIVGCLPYYPKKEKVIYPEFLTQLAKTTGWQITIWTTSNKQKHPEFIFYQRPQASVGHAIFKLFR